MKFWSKETRARIDFACSFGVKIKTDLVTFHGNFESLLVVPKCGRFLRSVLTIKVSKKGWLLWNMCGQYTVGVSWTQLSTFWKVRKLPVILLKFLKSWYEYWKFYIKWTFRILVKTKNLELVWDTINCHGFSCEGVVLFTEWKKSLIDEVRDCRLRELFLKCSYMVFKWHVQIVFLQESKELQKCIIFYFTQDSLTSQRNASCSKSSGRN